MRAIRNFKLRKVFEFSLVYLCAYNAQSARISRRSLADIYSVGDIVEV